MTSKRTTRKTKRVQIIEHGTDLPEARNGAGQNGPAAHWVEVAEAAKERPGTWLIVRLDHLTRKGHQSAASTINAATRNSDSKTGKNAAFMEPGYQAAYREGELYVRYDQPTKVRSIGKRSA
jgi:hypothetical protein